MSEFEPAVAFLLNHEGGYVNDPTDPGGETKFGISKRSYPNEDIKNLTVARAMQIYKQDWWDAYNFGAITVQRVANKVFDLAVNIGPVPAIRIFQMAIGKAVAGPLVADGKIGPQTVAQAAAADADGLVKEIKARAAVYHASLNKSEDLLGWLRRDVDG